MKAVRIVFIIMFMALLVVPAVTMPLSKNDTNTEKRELAKFPKLVVDGKLNEHFSDGLDEYLKDHIGLRQTLVNTNSSIMSTVFGESSVDNVILGEQGWLYYGNTVDDYVNVPTLSERNVNNIAYTLSMVQKYVESKDAKFLFTSIPNKNSIYGEHMPYNYVKTDNKGNYELINDALTKYEVNHADVLAAFKNESEVLYQTTDSHWNYKGALLGYNTILNAAQYDHNEFANTDFEERTDWDGDLAVMLYSTKAKKDKQLYPVLDFKYYYTSPQDAVDAITLETMNDSGKGSLVMYRDSFLNTAQVYFAENFKTATFSRALPYKIDLVSEKQADIVILEIVERNLINLAGRAPFMPAPLVSIDAKVNVVDAAKISKNSEEVGEYTHIYGCIDESLIGKEYKAYIMLKNSDDYSSYEAFPIFEKELLKSDVTKDNGFSAYIPTNVLEKYEEAYVMVYSDGAYYIAQ